MQEDRQLLAYAADLFDGEGYVCISRTITQGPAPHYSLVAAITMTDPQAIEYMASGFGGHLRRQERSRPGWSSYYVWALRGPQAHALLEAIRPYLLVKDKQADVGIRFYKGYYTPKDVRPTTRVTVDRVAFAEECKRELERLNERGELPPPAARKLRVPRGQLALKSPTGGRPRAGAPLPNVPDTPLLF